ncbi:MAG: gliding motility-associated C-terminal domain-containing protein [Bacteroidota bacterium]|jgi:gliding motility-associated-like protein
MKFKTLIKNLFKTILFFCFLNNFAFSQSLDRQVINSNGGRGTTSSGVTLDYNIGEPVVVTGTDGANYFTQGFIQPDTVFTSGIFSVNIFYSSESCINAHDGFIMANPVNAVGQVTWIWYPSMDTLPTLTNLSAGTYILSAIDSIGNSIIDTVVITPSTNPCDLDFYNAITPNGDGKNDAFIITNINTYPNNSLFIFNRYGLKVWEGKNYDNTNVIFVGKDNNGFDLPPATYFYVLIVDGGERKGWLELLK